MQARMQAQGVGAGSDCPAADLKSSGGSSGVAYLRLQGAVGGVQGLGPTVFNARALVSYLAVPCGRLARRVVGSHCPQLLARVESSRYAVSST